MKTTKGVISEYVERKDLNGLAEYAYAMVEDWMVEVEQAKEETREECAKIAENMHKHEAYHKNAGFPEVNDIVEEAGNNIATAIRNNKTYENNI